MFGMNICISIFFVNIEDEVKSFLFSCEIDGMCCVFMWFSVFIVMVLIV